MAQDIFLNLSGIAVNVSMGGCTGTRSFLEKLTRKRVRQNGKDLALCARVLVAGSGLADGRCA
ncbi:hypothetical protein D3C86_1541870 [compost metagenome]